MNDGGKAGGNPWKRKRELCCTVQCSNPPASLPSFKIYKACAARRTTGWDCHSPGRWKHSRHTLSTPTFGRWQSDGTLRSIVSHAVVTLLRGRLELSASPELDVSTRPLAPSPGPRPTVSFVVHTLSVPFYVLDELGLIPNSVQMDSCASRRHMCASRAACTSRPILTTEIESVRLFCCAVDIFTRVLVL